MPLESMWIGNLIPGLSMQEPHRDVPPDKVPPPKHPPDVIPFDPDEEPDFPPGGPPIKDPQPDPEPSMYTRSSLERIQNEWNRSEFASPRPRAVAYATRACVAIERCLPLTLVKVS